MSKKNLIIAGVVIIGIVFIGYNLLGGDKSQETAKEGSNIEQDQNGDEAESFFGSMQDLLTRGKSVKCTYENVGGGGGEATGVFYIAGNKMRSEVEIIEEETGKEMETNSIVIGDWMYTWNNFMPGGIKMNIKEMQGEVDENYSQGEADKMKEKMDYKCQPWIPDNSKFVVPTDIEFRDMTEMTEGFNVDGMEKNAEKASAQLCETCEMLTGKDRDECRANAGCE